MPWQPSIAEVTSPASVGSGFAIAPDIVVTAGHVLCAAGSAPPPPSSVRVRIGGQVLPASRLLVHGRWSVQGRLSGDMAMIRLSGPVAPGLATVRDFDPPPSPDGDAVGVLQGGVAGPFAVALQRRVSSQGFHMFWGRGLTCPAGVSGGPFLFASGAGSSVVGVITAVATTPSIPVFVGLPLLDATFGFLLANI